jgi:hypothetical protein
MVGDWDGRTDGRTDEPLLEPLFFSPGFLYITLIHTSWYKYLKVTVPSQWYSILLGPRVVHGERTK